MLPGGDDGEQDVMQQPRGGAQVKPCACWRSRGGGSSRAVVLSGAPSSSLQDTEAAVPPRLSPPRHRSSGAESGGEGAIPTPADPRVGGGGGGSGADLDQMYLMLDPQLQPLEPEPGSPESVRVFEEHKQLAQEYLRVQTEMAFTSSYRARLAEQLSVAEAGGATDAPDPDDAEAEEIRKLESEKESLLQLHRNLTKQLELIRRQRGPVAAPGTDPGWVVVPRPAH